MGQNPGIFRILIVDDHPLVREGLALRINNESNMVVCGEADDVDKAVQAVKALNPDLAVVDISLKKGNGIDLIKKIAGDCPETKVLVSSMHGELHYAQRSIAAGALGYIHKQQSPERVIEAIREVLDGQIYLCPHMTRQIVQHGFKERRREPGSLVDVLTDRELEVFELIGHGQSTGQIAIDLGISVNTVDTHRRKLRNKLNLDSGAELVRLAVQWVLENT